MSEGKGKVSNYFTYPLKFISYRWYKPILVTLMAIVFYFCLVLVVALLARVLGGAAQAADVTGYDGVDMHTPGGIMLNMGSVAVMALALYFASLVVKDRPFSSYSSSRGGWDFKIFFKCLAITFFVVVIPNTIITIVQEGGIHFDNQMGLMGFVFLFALVPLQCIAEEYIFRGLLTQTIGSWIKMPIVAIILQTILFTLGHPYNVAGKVEIFLSGTLMGIMTLLTNGLEASSAAHVANNLTFFLMNGFGMIKLTSDSTWDSTIGAFVIYAIYVLILYSLKKKGWFEHIQKDDVTIFNERVLKKQNQA